MKKNRNGKGKQVRKPVAENFAPKRLAINFDPPMLIMEYLVIDSGKLYHHKMRLDSILKKPKVSRDDVLNYVKNKHYLYFESGKVSDPQILKFIDKVLLRKGLISQNEVLANNYQFSSSNVEVRKDNDDDDDFQYLNDEEEEYYEEDYEDYEDPSNFNPKNNANNGKGNEEKKKNAFMTYCQDEEGEEEEQGQASWDLDMDENADFV